MKKTNENKQHTDGWMGGHEGSIVASCSLWELRLHVSNPSWGVMAETTCPEWDTTATAVVFLGTSNPGIKQTSKPPEESTLGYTGVWVFHQALPTDFQGLSSGHMLDSLEILKPPTFQSCGLLFVVLYDVVGVWWKDTPQKVSEFKKWFLLTVLVWRRTPPPAPNLIHLNIWPLIGGTV